MSSPPKKDGDNKDANAKQLMPPPRIIPPTPVTVNFSSPPPSPRLGRDKTSSAMSKGLLGSDLATQTPKRLGDVRRLSAENGLPTLAWARRTSDDVPTKRPDSSQTRAISPAELKKHNKKDDCWMALRGHVYDVTEYIPYHPGGVKEIMKGAGIDGTALFNSIHRYVNPEALLGGCQVGVYSRRPTLNDDDEERAISFIPKSMVHRDSVVNENLGLAEKKKCWGCKICDFCKGKRDAVPGLIPVTAFAEDDNYVTYKVSLQGLKYSRDYWSVALLDKEKLLLKVITKPPDVWMAYFQLASSIEDDTIHMSFTNRYKNLILKIPKAERKPWTKLGEPLPDHNEIEDSRRALEDMVPASLIRRETIGHNILFITVRLHQSGRLGVPVGFDVKIRINGKARRYTPVLPIFNTAWDTKDEKHQILHFIYKFYPNGAVTPLLTQLPVNPQGQDDSLLIGASSGNFDTDWLQGADGLILLAAGSGLTPYIRIIQFLLDHNIALGINHVILIHWNKTENEIIWKDEFEKLEEAKSWFHFIPVLTRGDGTWSGLRGRIGDDLLKTCLGLVPNLTRNKQRIRWMSCGSDGFNTNATQTIESIGHIPDSVFVFLG